MTASLTFARVQGRQLQRWPWRSGRHRERDGSGWVVKSCLISLGSSKFLEVIIWKRRLSKQKNAIPKMKPEREAMLFVGAFLFVKKTLHLFDGWSKHCFSHWVGNVVWWWCFSTDLREFPHFWDVIAKAVGAPKNFRKVMTCWGFTSCDLINSFKRTRGFLEQKSKLVISWELQDHFQI